MRNVFVIVLALWSGVAMAQGSNGVSRAVYANDKLVQAGKDSVQAATDQAQNNAIGLKLSNPIVVDDVATLNATATGSAPKFIICKSDPDYSSDPTINLWIGGVLYVFVAQKRN